MSLVSILISTYNRADYVLKAINSALDQTYKDIEVIVYDDGSGDGTFDIVDRKVTDPRVRYEWCRKNQGVGHARNQLLRMAKGEYACWNDSDDASNIWRVALMLEAIKRTGAPLLRSGFTIMPSKSNEGIHLKPGVQTKPLYACATAFFKTSLARQIKFGEDLFLGEDYPWEKEFMYRFGQPYHVPLSLYLVGRGSRLRRLQSRKNNPAYVDRVEKSGELSRDRGRAIIEKLKAEDKPYLRTFPFIPEELTKELLARCKRGTC